MRVVMALNNYRSTDDTRYGQMGPCLVKGHAKEHKLDTGCLAAMRNFFYNDGKFGKTFDDFLKAVNRK